MPMIDTDQQNEIPLDEVDTEDFNQIDPNILDCFPKYKIPVDLYHWRDDLAFLKHVYKRNRNLDKSQRTALYQLSEAGLLFFSRRQIVEYTKSVACDLNAALNDPNLTWDEKAIVFFRALTRAQEEFFSQPKTPQFEQLNTILNSLCDHLIENNRRIDKIVQELHNNISPQRRRVNASLMALALYLEIHKGGILAETLDNVALGFMLYDIGMSHVSPMMLAKPQQLTTMDQRAMREHPNKGVEILKKLDLDRPEIIEPTMQHHERLNGSGYPNKLVGDRMGQLARIVAVTDTYAAMITDTPQRKGGKPIKAATELIENEDLYDRFICRTLIHFLKNIPSV